MANKDLIKETLELAGVSDIRPLRNTLFLRTRPVEEKSSGGLWLPPSETKFHGGPAHKQLARGVVIAAGPKAVSEPGDEIAFTKVYFAYWKKFADGTMLGWIDENQVIGKVEDPEGTLDG